MKENERELKSRTCLHCCALFICSHVFSNVPSKCFQQWSGTFVQCSVHKFSVTASPISPAKLVLRQASVKHSELSSQSPLRLFFSVHAGNRSQMSGWRTFHHFSVTRHFVYITINRFPLLFGSLLFIASHYHD